MCDWEWHAGVNLVTSTVPILLLIISDEVVLTPTDIQRYITHSSIITNLIIA